MVLFKFSKPDFEVPTFIYSEGYSFWFQFPGLILCFKFYQPIWALICLWYPLTCYVQQSGHCSLSRVVCRVASLLFFQWATMWVKPWQWQQIQWGWKRCHCMRLKTFLIKIGFSKLRYHSTVPQFVCAMFFLSANCIFIHSHNACLIVSFGVSLNLHSSPYPVLQRYIRWTYFTI